MFPLQSRPPTHPSRRVKWTIPTLLRKRTKQKNNQTPCKARRALRPPPKRPAAHAAVPRRCSASPIRRWPPERPPSRTFCCSGVSPRPPSTRYITSDFCTTQTSEPDHRVWACCILCACVCAWASFCIELTGLSLPTIVRTCNTIISRAPYTNMQHMQTAEHPQTKRAPQILFFRLIFVVVFCLLSNHILFASCDLYFRSTSTEPAWMCFLVISFCSASLSHSEPHTACFDFDNMDDSACIWYLYWCVSRLRLQNIQITNFSTAWSDGLAFCALIHHFYPDAFDYTQLTAKQRRHNFTLAFRVAEWVFYWCSLVLKLQLLPN